MPPDPQNALHFASVGCSDFYQLTTWPTQCLKSEPALSPDEWTGQSPPTAEVLTVNAQQGASGSEDHQASIPCIFCKGSHFDDICHRFSSLGERKQSLSQQGRHFLCLKTGHMMKECPSANKYLVIVVSGDNIINRCL